MFILISNLNFKITILNIITIKKNLNYIAKLKLFTNIILHINFCSIFNNIYINHLIIISNTKLYL